MADYIDRESIKYETWAVAPLCRPLMVVRKATIDNIPAADVAPVVHGKWEWFEEEHGTIDTGWDRDWGWRCSGCKDTLNDEYDDPDNPPKHKYCPNCGAKMQDE